MKGQYYPLLHTLDLSNNTIGSHGAVPLASGLMCEKMKYVNFSYNKIGTESVEALAALVQSCHVQILDLSHNNIGSSGAKRLITELIYFHCPVKFNLLSNNISPDDIETLTEKLRRNTNLHVLLSSNSQASHPQ